MTYAGADIEHGARVSELQARCDQLEMVAVPPEIALTPQEGRRMWTPLPLLIGHSTILCPVLGASSRPSTARHTTVRSGGRHSPRDARVSALRTGDLSGSVRSRSWSICLVRAEGLAVDGILEPFDHRLEVHDALLKRQKPIAGRRTLAS
jgi:hypothetical protein